MTIAPFREFITKRLNGDDMLPFEATRTARFSFRNVSVIMNHIFALCVLGSAIKGCLVGTVNFPYQNSLRLVKRTNLRIPFSGSINRFRYEADQKHYE